MLENGFLLVNDFMSEEQICEIVSELNRFQPSSGISGIRNAEKKLHSIAHYLTSSDIIETAGQFLNGPAELVRAILFNKTSENNWSVSWHQDKTVAVTNRFNENGWGPWSIKEDIVHVQPPLVVLNQMITFRIHLDASTNENGSLKVIPKSQEQGIIKPDLVPSFIKDKVPTECTGKRGSALIMRPHLLHSSSRGTGPSQRRVLHLEFSSYILPKGVKWA